MTAEWVDAAQVRIRESVYTAETGAGTRYRVKWRVRSDHTKTFIPPARSRTPKAEAERFLARLVEARVAGQAFHAVDGLPAAMRVVPEPVEAPEAPERTIVGLACDVIAEGWKEWSPGNRRSRVESMAHVLAHFVSGPRPPARSDLIRAARDLVLPPEELRMEAVTPEVEAAAAYLYARSLPVSSLTRAQCTLALVAAATKADGTLYAHDARQHQRTSLSLVCRLAMDEHLLTANPVREVKRISETTTVDIDDESEDPEHSDVVDLRQVATPAQCRALVEAVCKTSWSAGQYRAYFTLLWMTGMRPSEASGIRLNADLVLPEQGWGTVRLRRATVATGVRWTGTGKAHADRRKLKGRSKGVTRTVPLPPETVAAIRAHVEANGLKSGDRLFTNTQGKPFDPSAMGKAFRRGRDQLYADTPLASLTIYQLRHSAARMMLEAGVSPVKVAEVLGNSAVVLMRTYARLLEGDDETFRAKLDAVLGETQP